MPPSAFDDWAEAYEAMIDWPKRLANEAPFFRWLVERAGAGSALDVAAGTGRHAAMLHSWGLRIQGADLSPAMIARARQEFRESEGLRWVVRGFTEPADAPGAFDLAICTGNSLALAPDHAAAGRAIRQMMLAVRPGGLIAIHLINLWRWPDGFVQWQKTVRTRLACGESLIVKGNHRCGARGYVDLLVTVLEGGSARLHSDCVPFLGFTAEELTRLARDAGAQWAEIYGDYGRTAYDEAQSTDLILVAGASSATSVVTP